MQKDVEEKEDENLHEERKRKKKRKKKKKKKENSAFRHMFILSETEYQLPEKYDNNLLH